jgi:group II intron reverse transcriptase/maturase
MKRKGGGSVREQTTRRQKALAKLGRGHWVQPEYDYAVLCAKPADADRGGGITLCDEVFSDENIECAISRVVSNKGAAGVDGMTVDELQGWWVKHGTEVKQQCRNLKYTPKCVRAVKIPKPNSGTRQLGIPCVSDRMIQQAVAQVLSPIIDPTFSEHSFGFRPERSAHDAIKQARQYYDEGYTTVIDIDLKSYFDTVNHDILMDLLERKKGITDPVVLHIIKKSLMSGVMEGGIVSPRVEGTPQGCPLSPLLSNVYLDVFDKELEKRGHAFVRYADDVNIYVKSRRAGGRVMASAVAFLEGKLRLTVNPDKSEVGDPSKLKFLGFTLGKGADGAYIRVHPASIRRLKDKIRRITKRNRGISLVSMLKELKRALNGWINYFGIARCKRLCDLIDKWVRRRIRQFIWKQWKKPKARSRKLRALGMDKDKAYQWGNTRKGYWRVSKTPFLDWALNNDYLSKQGLFSLYRHYTTKMLK